MVSGVVIYDANGTLQYFGVEDIKWIDSHDNKTNHPGGMISTRSCLDADLSAQIHERRAAEFRTQT